MKLYGLHLFEEADAPGGQSNTVAKIVAAALKGIGRAILALSSVIVHGLLGQAVADGKVKPSDAVDAVRVDRRKKLRDIFKKDGKDPDSLDPTDPVSADVESNSKKYQEVRGMIAELEELWKEAADKASIALAEWSASDNFFKIARTKSLEGALEYEASILKKVYEFVHKHLEIAKKRKNQDAEHTEQDAEQEPTQDEIDLQTASSPE